MNLRGAWTLFLKEVLRFAKVTVQTVLTPVVTALLYLLVFGHLLEDRVEVVGGIGYGVFLVPGLVMMGMMQNAFANSSSSLIQSKMTGNLLFVLLAPISPLEFWLAFVAAAVVRGVVVGAGVWLAASFLVDLPAVRPGLIAAFAVLASGVLGGLGVIAGLWAEKFEHLAAFQNFVIVPLVFLSGVFYSVNQLPPLWQAVSQYNPFFYMIDGFRYGFLGAGDVEPGRSLAVAALFFAAVTAAGIWILRRGYRIRR